MTFGKHLFKVTNTHTNKDASGFFEDKATAKLYRDELNGGLSTEDDKHWKADKGWRVTYDRNHWRYTS